MTRLLKKPFARAVLDAMPVHIAVLDRHGVIVEVNAAWQRFALENGVLPGAPAARCEVGVDYLAVCHAATGLAAEGAAEAAEGIQAVLDGRQPEFYLEYPCHAPDQRRWFMMRVNPLATKEGEIVISHTDITKRRLAEQAQQASETRLQLALETSEQGVWDWDMGTGEIFLSPGYYAMSGHPPRRRADHAFFQRLVHPDDWPAVQANLTAHLRGESNVSDIEYRMLTTSGAIRWIHSRSRVTERNAQGTALRMLGLITDVTDHKELELALRKSEARYRAVVQDQTEVIVRFCGDGTILFANDVFCRVFGQSRKELIGSRWHPIAHPDDLAMIEARLSTLSPEQPVVVIENRIYTADGSVHWMQFVNRAFFDATGQISAIQAVGRDITERKEIEARKDALHEENIRLGRELIHLQERERARLAQELHDELSQQLVAIRTRAGAIRRRSAAADSQADAMAIEALAQQIYDVSHRIMEGLHPMILDNANLTEALHSLLRGWSEMHPEIHLSLRLAGTPGNLSVDSRIHLYRILQECLANVVRHAHARRVRVFLGVRQRGKERMLDLVVRDDGIGLDMAAPRHGYGLILMRERAHNLGGDFDLRGHPDQGVRVAIAVPLPEH